MEDTPVQKDMVDLKSISCSKNDGSVGLSYWRSFMKRNGDKIVSTKGQKYELDRSKWTNYRNFDKMYEQIEEEMIEAKVTSQIYMAWMDKDGNTVLEADAFGCKVGLDIKRRDIMLMMDETGGNTSQKGDGFVGGEKLLCERGTVVRQKISVKDKHYTVLGLTNLDGETIMCIVIIAGIKRSVLVETGLDVTADLVGTYGDVNFMKDNSGPGKRFPGGPTCEYKGKQVPCLFRFSEKGGITSEILIDILKALDTLGVFDANRANGIKPLLLVDGHITHFDLAFLHYI